MANLIPVAVAAVESLVLLEAPAPPLPPPLPPLRALHVVLEKVLPPPGNCKRLLAAAKNHAA